MTYTSLFSLCFSPLHIYLWLETRDFLKLYCLLACFHTLFWKVLTILPWNNDQQSLAMGSSFRGNCLGPPLTVPQSMEWGVLQPTGCAHIEITPLFWTTLQLPETRETTCTLLEHAQPLHHFRAPPLSGWARATICRILGEGCGRNLRELGCLHVCAHLLVAWEAAWGEKKGESEAKNRSQLQPPFILSSYPDP